MEINDGEIVKNFFNIIDEYLSNISNNKNMQKEINQFNNSFKDLIHITDHIKLFDKDKISEKNGAAVEYLEMFSYVAVGFMWLKMLEISHDKNSKNKSDFFESKIETGIYYFQKIITKTNFLKENILSGASNYINYKDKFFDSSFKL